MGKPISDLFIEKAIEGLDIETCRQLDGVRNLSPENLKLFFDQFFSTMSLTAKETIVEILWNSMSVREQHLFDMPNFDHRMSTLQIHSNLSPSQLNNSQRRVTRGFISRLDPVNNASPPSQDENSPVARPVVSRSRITVGSPWRRLNLLRDSNASVTNAGTDTSVDSGIAARRQPLQHPTDRSSFIQSVRIQQHNEQQHNETLASSEDSPLANSNDASSSGGELGNQIMNILMDVVLRAERAATDANVIQRSLNTWNERREIATSTTNPNGGSDENLESPPSNSQLQ